MVRREGEEVRSQKGVYVPEKEKGLVAVTEAQTVIKK